MEQNPWKNPCYESVPWPEVDDDSTRLYRTQRGSWSMVVSILEATMVGVAGNLLFAVFEPYIKQRLNRWRGVSEDEQQRYQQNVKDVIPFFREADIFVGQRQPWVQKKLDQLGRKLGDSLEQNTSLDEAGLRQLRTSLSLEGDQHRLADIGIPTIGDVTADDQSVYKSLENVGSLSANEYFQTLELVVSANLAMTEEQPTNVILANETDVDFSSDVISIGGPISNLFTRNVIYGTDISLPYRFDLNPAGVDDDLSTYSPQQLREIGLSDDREFGHRPNWSIVDKNGEAPKIQEKETIPKWGDGAWDLDYFMVAKVPNTHPAAPPLRQAETKRALILAGCHGYGTRAALEALKSGDILETINSKVEDGYFQLIGRVKRNNGAEIRSEDIVIPDEHLQGINIS